MRLGATAKGAARTARITANVGAGLTLVELWNLVWKLKRLMIVLLKLIN